MILTIQSVLFLTLTRIPPPTIYNLMLEDDPKLMLHDDRNLIPHDDLKLIPCDDRKLIPLDHLQMVRVTHHCLYIPCRWFLLPLPLPHAGARPSCTRQPPPLRRRALRVPESSRRGRGGVDVGPDPVFLLSRRRAHEAGGGTSKGVGIRLPAIPCLGSFGVLHRSSSSGSFGKRENSEQRPTFRQPTNKNPTRDKRQSNKSRARETGTSVPM